MKTFNHLQTIQLGYLEHFYNASKYAFLSLKASCFFMCHAVWPDIFVVSGSNTIDVLYKELHN